MNKQAFLALLNNPDKISSSDLEGLEEVLQNFPYFQAAQILMAKGAKDQGKMLAEKKVRKAAVYAGERKVLKKLLHNLPPSENLSTKPEPVREATPVAKEVTPIITEKTPLQEKEKLPETEIKNEVQQVVEEKQPVAFTQSPEQSVEKTDKPITQTSTPASGKDKFFDELQENLKSLHAIREKLANQPTIREMEKVREKQKKEVASLKKESNVTEEKPTVIPKDVKAVVTPEPVKEQPSAIEKSTESLLPEKIKEHTSDLDLFTSRLDETISAHPSTDRTKAVDEGELLLNYLSYLQTSKKTGQEKKKTEEIIEKFIKEDPSIPYLNPREVPEEQEDKAEESYKLKQKPLSENMAKLLLLQGKKEKAIEIYEQLILKFPEKKTYFASQIEKIKQK